MFKELDAQADPAVDSLKAGLLIDTTMDEVESAFNAAVKTPGVEDDQRAMHMLHQASFRFFENAE